MIHRPLRYVTGINAKFTRARYTGPVTPALQAHIRGESDIFTESLAQRLFFRPAIAGEPFIRIKSTSEFRSLLKLLVSVEYTNTEIEMFIKKAVDTTAAKYGLPPSVDVSLYNCQFVSSKHGQIGNLCAVGIENHGIGRVICPDRQYCAALLRQISSIPVSVYVAGGNEMATSNTDIF